MQEILYKALSGENLKAEVSQDEIGMRLDVFLGKIFPEFGLRARKRLWEWCRITVDGLPKSPGFTLLPGSLVEVALSDNHSVQVGTSNDLSGDMLEKIHIVYANSEFMCLRKPEGLPSANISGSPKVNLETLFKQHREALWVDFLRKNQPNDGERTNFSNWLSKIPTTYISCNRLDTETSGLVLYAFDEKAHAKFRRLEIEGKVNKDYFALVEGNITARISLSLAMNTDNRKKTLVLDADSADPLRHSLVYPLEQRVGDEHAKEPLTLVQVRIWRGARHQIRAHLAANGTPIVGDELYGSGAKNRLYLHHVRLAMPGFSAFTDIEWGGELLEL